jgi:hypothetical protein
MKRYFKEIDGKKVYKTRSEIVIAKGDMNIYNPTEEMILLDGWIEYIEPEPEIEPELSEEEKLNQALLFKLDEITYYDESEAVNSCIIIHDGVEMLYWANKSERSSLKTAIEDCLKLGRENYRLDIRDLNLSIQIPCEHLLKMLSELEIYAIDCYNKTSDHIFEVKKLSTIEEIDNYNNHEGYPDKLVFHI